MLSPIVTSSSRQNLRKSWEQNPDGALPPKRASSYKFGTSSEGQARSTAGSHQLQGFSEYDLGAPWEAPRENGHYHKPTQLYDLNVLRRSRSLCTVDVTAIYQLAIASTKI